MLSRACLLIIICSCLLKHALPQANSLPAIGQWREHLPYGSVLHVTKSSNGIFAATPYSLFHLNFNSSEIRRWSKITGLAETGISTIRSTADGGKLLVAYSNSNIDIVLPGNIINIPDIKRKNIIGDKSVYDIYISGDLAYLSTGFGIVVLDLLKNETKDTWFIGTNGQQLKVTGINIDAGFIYAATTDGLKRAPVSADLRNFNLWQNISGINGLAAGPVRQVMSFNGKLLALTGDSIMSLTGTSWTKFYSAAFNISSINISENKLLISGSNSANQGRVVVIKTDGVVESTLSQNILQRPQEALMITNNFWIADQFSGLIRSNGNTFEKIIPNSSFEKASGEMIFHRGKLFVAAGEVNSSWIYTYNRFGLYKFENNNWSYFNQYNYPLLDSVYDVITVAGDPRNDDIYYGSYSGGLVRLSAGNNFTIYKQNSAIGPAVGDLTSYRVSGLAFDHDNNLWISNYGAINNLLVKKADNTWKSFTTPFTLTENATSQLTIDENNNKWIVSPKGNGLVCFNHGSSIDNTADDKWRLFRFGAGNGNLPDNVVYCTAKDKNGLIWVGTAKGIGIIACTDDPFSNSCQSFQPIVAQGNFAGPLFATEEVKAIAVDGANRKWIGTKNGLWLITADGEKVINYFNEDNSPLISNSILRIAIDPSSGEIFIATANGLCSFRGTATEATGTINEVLVFPNPVPASYKGTIAIKGLPANSNVKITELDGRLVYETKALGGQAIWNGKDYRGRQISSGVYLVLVKASDGNEKLVTKIFIIK